MSRDFDSKNTTRPNKLRFNYRGLWKTTAYEENDGLGPKISTLLKESIMA